MESTCTTCSEYFHTPEGWKEQLGPPAPLSAGMDGAHLICSGQLDAAKENWHKRRRIAGTALGAALELTLAIKLLAFIPAKSVRGLVGCVFGGFGGRRLYDGWLQPRVEAWYETHYAEQLTPVSLPDPDDTLAPSPVSSPPPGKKSGYESRAVVFFPVSEARHSLRLYTKDSEQYREVQLGLKGEHLYFQHDNVSLRIREEFGKATHIGKPVTFSTEVGQVELFVHTDAGDAYWPVRLYELDDEGTKYQLMEGGNAIEVQLGYDTVS